MSDGAKCMSKDPNVIAASPVRSLERLRDVVVVIGACALLLAAPACQSRSPFSLFEMEMPPETTHEIGSMHMADQSRSEPQTVDDASEGLLESFTETDATPVVKELSLADVRSHCLANNLDLRVQLFEPTISQASVDEEEAKFEAAFTASVRRTDNDTPIALATASSQSTFDSFDFGVNLPLQTGGNVNLNVPFSRTDTDNAFSLLNPAFSSAARFSLSQPLLRNAGVRTNTHSIRIARGNKQIADARTKLEAIRILANADRAYWNLFAARQELAVRIQQYELAVEQLERARRRLRNGDVAEIEVTRAQSAVAQQLEAIIIARTTVRRSERDLKRIMNRDDLPVSGRTQLVPLTDPNPLGFDLHAGALSDFAVTNRMEMLELELQLAIDASTIGFEENQALPLVTLDFSYSFDGLGSSLGDSFTQIRDRTFDNWSIGVSAEIPIGNEAAKARVHRAILTRLQRLATREQREQSIRLEVLDAIDQMQQDWQRILAARQEVILAGKTYEAETRQFNNGIRTSTDVRDAAADLADAQSREIRALTDYQNTLVDIAFATGTLLGHGRIIWEPLDDQHNDG